MKHLNSRILTFLLLILLAIPAALSLLHSGFYEPHDLHHVADIYQMVRAIQSGQIPPRLGPDFTFGYGYPLFNFYYVLPFYLGAAFFFIVGSLTLSYKLVFLVTIFLSVFGIYLFLRETFGRWPAFVGTALSLYTPYRAVEIYVRGAMGEALAFAILPFVCWSALKVIKNKNIKSVIVFGLITSVFILSHNYMWALSLPWVFGFLFLAKDKIKSFFQLCGGVLLAMLISAYWWLPAIFEQKDIKSATPFPLIDHFPFLKQLIIPSWGYGASLWGPSDGLSFQIGIVNLIVIAICAIVLFVKRKEAQKQNVFILGLWTILGCTVTFVMMNVRTYPLWIVLPFHDFIQFPWRLLFFVPLFTGILASIAIELLGGKYRKRVAGLGIIAGSILLTFSYFSPSGYFYKTDNQYLHRFFANRSIEGEVLGSSEEYVNYSEDYLLLSKWMDQKPTSLPENRITSDNGIISNITQISPVSWSATSTSSEQSRVTFYAYYFPGWYASIDGKETPISPVVPNGQIELEVPEGQHNLKFYWKETPLRKITDGISLISAIGIIVTLFII